MEQKIEDFSGAQDIKIPLVKTQKEKDTSQLSERVLNVLRVSSLDWMICRHRHGDFPMIIQILCVMIVISKIISLQTSFEEEHPTMRSMPRLLLGHSL